MSKLTIQLQKLISETVEKAKEIGRQMAEEINSKYGRTIQNLASKLGVTMFLTVEEGLTHPLLVTVKLYHTGDKNQSEQIKQELSEPWHQYPFIIEETSEAPDDALYVYKPEEK